MKRSLFTPLVVLALAAWAGPGGRKDRPGPPPPPAGADTLEVSGYKEVLALFEKLHYTPAAWQAGIRSVPRVYVTDLTERWRDTTVNQITVLAKKQIFFRALAPLVLHSNELILADRKRLAGNPAGGPRCLVARKTPSGSPDLPTSTMSPLLPASRCPAPSWTNSGIGWTSSRPPLR